MSTILASFMWLIQGQRKTGIQCWAGCGGGRGREGADKSILEFNRFYPCYKDCYCKGGGYSGLAMAGEIYVGRIGICDVTNNPGQKAENF